MSLIAKTQFVADMRDAFETNAVLPVLHETITKTHNQPEEPPEVFRGGVLVNVDLECKRTPPLLCFPMGQVGEQLSEWDCRTIVAYERHISHQGGDIRRSRSRSIVRSSLQASKDVQYPRSPAGGLTCSCGRLVKVGLWV